MTMLYPNQCYNTVCYLLITFANSLNTDHDLDPRFLKIIFLRIFCKIKVNFE